MTMVPFFEGWVASFWPPVYVVFVSLVVSGFSNAVNLADGLDGLAAGLGAIALATFAVLAYLGLLYLPGSGNSLSSPPPSWAGAVGFLWFNSYPAEVFMGDTGALALGGALASSPSSSRPSSFS